VGGGNNSLGGIAPISKTREMRKKQGNKSKKKKEQAIFGIESEMMALESGRMK
jgi:hypothetical protein